MRKLIALQGLPGAGKSTLIAQAGLKDYTLSSDELRLLLASPRLRADGSLEISQKNGGRVWQLLFEILESRMLSGATTCVDATHLTQSSLQPYRKLAQRYGYKLQLCSLRKLSFEVCAARNAARDPLRRVPAEVMSSFAEQLAKFETPPWIEEIDSADLPKALSGPVQALGDLAGLHFIGDLRGYCEPLDFFLQECGSLDAPLVFTGDLFGEGPHNAEILRSVLPQLEAGRALVCEGYMERQLRLHLAGKTVRSEIFLNCVRPQFLAAECTREELELFLSHLRELICWDEAELKLLVSHGGLPRPWPASELGRLAADDLILGAGPVDAAVDESFAAHAAGQLQIHGHRNAAGAPLEAAPGSFNLSRTPPEWRALSWDRRQRCWTPRLFRENLQPAAALP